MIIINILIYAIKIDWNFVYHHNFYALFELMKISKNMEIKYEIMKLLKIVVVDDIIYHNQVNEIIIHHIDLDVNIIVIIDIIDVIIGGVIEYLSIAKLILYFILSYSIFT